MRNLIFPIIMILIFTINLIVMAATQTIYGNTNEIGIIRVDEDNDEDVLYSGSVGIAYRSYRESDAGFHWLSLTGVSYMGDNDFFHGEYELFVEINPFQRSVESTFEGPVEGNSFDIMFNSITPPPQNKDFPEIGRCNAKSTIKGNGFKAKSSGLSTLKL